MILICFLGKKNPGLRGQGHLDEALQSKIMAMVFSMVAGV